VTLAAEQK
jgi:hypothetical protein